MTTTGALGWKKTVFICALALLAAAGVTVLIFSTEPTAVRGGATKQTAMLVEVTGVERGTFRPRIVATGTVRAAQDIVLSPRVDGQIVELSPRFTPGGSVDKGETLLRIETADYQNTLQQRRSELRQALSELNIEMGRQNVADRELKLLEDELPDDVKARALRKPQLHAARGRVEAARAAVEQARLNLRRTAVRAPFDGQVLTRNVNVGSQVAAGQDLGRLVGMDTYWVIVTVPHSKIRWLSFGDDSSQKGSKVRVHNRGAWPDGVHRTGRLDRRIGALDEQTRMIRLIVTVDDPLARDPETPKDKPALIVGEYLETRIRGEEIRDVVRINRDYVRDDATVWVMEDGKLDIRDVEIVMRDPRYAYLSKGLDGDDRVVTTNLSTVTDGAPLRVQGPGTSTEQSAAPSQRTGTTAADGGTAN